MTVIKKDEDVFEENLKQPDEILTFTIAQVDEQIAGCQKEIDELQADIVTLTTRKTSALEIK